MPRLYLKSHQRKNSLNRLDKTTLRRIKPSKGSRDDSSGEGAGRGPGLKFQNKIPPRWRKVAPAEATSNTRENEFRGAGWEVRKGITIRQRDRNHFLGALSRTGSFRMAAPESRALRQGRPTLRGCSMTRKLSFPPMSLSRDGNGIQIV